MPFWKRWQTLLWVILLLSFLARFYHLTTPLVDYHSWRQADTASIARNFYREGFQLLYPQIDWGGRSSGYLESEFPLFAFLVALLYKVFGLHDSLGRLLSILFSLGSVGLVFLIAKNLFSQKTALMSAVLFSVFPSSIYFGRAFMPDFLTLFATLLAIYLLILWYRSGRQYLFWLSGASLGLALALKISFAHTLVLVAGIFWLKHGWQFLAKLNFWLYMSMALLPPLVWYYHAHQLYLQTGLSFGIWEFGSDKWGRLEIWADPGFYKNLVLSKLGQSNLTWPGLFLLVGGIWQAAREKRRPICYLWLLSLLVFFLVVAKGNWMHDYYQLPFLPIAALLMGNFAYDKSKAGGRTWKKIVTVILLVGILVFSVARLHKSFTLRDRNRAVLTLSAQIQDLTPEGAYLVTVQKVPDPVLLYLSDRKGWNLSLNTVTLASLRGLAGTSAIYLAGIKRDFSGPNASLQMKTLLSEFQALADNDRFFILKVPESD